MLEIKREMQEKELALSLAGELDMATGEVLEDLLAQEDLSEVGKITFSLSYLDFIDSTGIGQLIKYFRFYSSRNIRVEIVNENPDIEELLEMIGLREIMGID